MKEDVFIPDHSGPPVFAPENATRKRPKTSVRDVWVILNPFGDVWTTDTFDDPDLARKHVADYWAGFISPPKDLTRFRVVKGRVRASAIFPIQNPPKPNDGGEADQLGKSGMNPKWLTPIPPPITAVMAFLKESEA